MQREMGKATSCGGAKARLGGDDEDPNNCSEELRIMGAANRGGRRFGVAWHRECEVRWLLAVWWVVVSSGER
ncbi:UNVERIFIED_CONTAM: hypothetical protein Slati_4479600 [Sesamum latifolium]|uniref:Uncharacterized protein n=1 Tax=Sesamum latifolium TaxID=2727402 RepID=A0AAW2SSS6_9LAMI